MNEKDIMAQIKRLHFEEAYKMLISSSLENPLLLSYCLRGLYRLPEALKYAGKVFDSKGRLEQIKCLFALGRTDEAKKLAQDQYIHNPDNSLLLTYASLLGEIGEVKKALALLDQVDEEDLENAQLTEFYVLKGDLLSFQEKNEEAFVNYDLALKTAENFEFPNWKALRLMLIHHNMADLYEQLENESLAIYHYEQAKKWMEVQKETDSSITDLSSYEIELLLSSANCFSNADEFQKAQSDLEKAKELFIQKPPYQKEYVKARIAYISALVKMNEDCPNKARTFFQEAFHAQKKLVEAGLDKKEHLARTAYYLASLTDQKDKKAQLYDLAYPVFKSVIEKEPTFYLSCLGEIENERGKMETNPEAALDFYDKAIDWYSRLLKMHPLDLLAKESLLICRVNRFKIQQDSFEKIQSGLKKLKEEDPAFVDSLGRYMLHQNLNLADQKWMESLLMSLPPLFEA